MSASGVTLKVIECVQEGGKKKMNGRGKRRTRRKITLGPGKRREWKGSSELCFG